MFWFSHVKASEWLQNVIDEGLDLSDQVQAQSRSMNFIFRSVHVYSTSYICSLVQHCVTCIFLAYVFVI
jgi:hypothetical protein